MFGWLNVIFHILGRPWQHAEGLLAEIEEQRLDHILYKGQYYKNYFVASDGSKN